MPSVCMITSAKGGVGKSTVCANLGMALARRGKRVLLCDCDLANRSLDLLTGLENSVIYGIADVLGGTVSIEQAAVPHPDVPSLLLLAASRHEQMPEPGKDAFRELISCTDMLEPDFVLLDMPGGNAALTAAAAAVCDEALVVSSPQVTSVRSAEATARLLEASGIPGTALVVNSFPVSRKRADRDRDFLTLLSLIDTVALQLRAVIPFDSTIWEKQNRGLLINSSAYRNSGFQSAFCNLAARQCGFPVPLFSRTAADFI